MKLSFRWYGVEDKIPLDHIRQIPGMKHIVSAIYDIPVGEIWTITKIKELKTMIEQAGLEFSVIESLSVHEDIKLQKGDYKRYIENYIESMKNLAAAGIKVICYNFMPVFDWTRTELDYQLADGSTTLAYLEKDIENINPFTTNLNLPGWNSSYTKAEIAELIEQYQAIGKQGLWNNLAFFIAEIMPIADQLDIKMAMHQDDPPWDIFGLPRIIVDEHSLDRLLSLHPSTNHGLTFCTGSLGCNPKNDLVHLVRKYGKANRIHFAHMRNLKMIGEKSFYESAHPNGEGSFNMVAIMQAYCEIGFTGYMRPDHGRMIWGETGKPGYGLYDRALGATYLLGLYQACQHALEED
ncbi:MAG: mannonate dehydratase [Culicoidibacterales bacterium]